MQNVTPKQSKIIQIILFKDRVKWRTGDQDISCLNSPHLFVRGGELTHSFEGEQDYFNEQDLPELTFEQFKNLYIKDMGTKQIKITPPEGFEIDTDKSTFECIVFKETPKKPVRITKWENFKELEGYYLSSIGNYHSGPVYHKSSRSNCCEDLWPTKELAEASLALCQLIRYRDNWNEGWVANWANNSNKFCIVVKANKITWEVLNMSNTLLVFKNEALLREFMATFQDLIEIAKPLL